MVAIQDSKTWLLDLGCTHHRTTHRKWFHEYIPLIKIHVMYMGDMRIQQAIAIGTIIIRLYSSDEINVHDVLYVSIINKNILSIGQIAASRTQMLIKHDTYWISTKNSQGIF